jgi:hypothetical protein
MAVLRYVAAVKEAGQDFDYETMGETAEEVFAPPPIHDNDDGETTQEAVKQEGDWEVSGGGDELTLSRIQSLSPPQLPVSTNKDNAPGPLLEVKATSPPDDEDEDKFSAPS